MTILTPSKQRHAQKFTPRERGGVVRVEKPAGKRRMNGAAVREQSDQGKKMEAHEHPATGDVK